MTMITQEAIEAFALAFWPVNAVSKMESCEGDIAKALEAALPFLCPIAGEGKVKALEWRVCKSGGLSAETIYGTYFAASLSNDFATLKLDRRLMAEVSSVEEAQKLAQEDYDGAILSALISSPGKDGGQEERQNYNCGCVHPSQCDRSCFGVQPASTALVERLTKALEEISDTRCVHDMGFDREIGPLGCSLGDKCVCVGLCTIASRALQEITTKALEGQELQAVAWRWKWKDCGSWIVTEGEPDANERRIIEPLYKSAHVAEPVEYHIVFDGFPSPDGPRFIEVENAAGQSINAGEWRKRADGLCELVIKAGVLING